MIAIIVWAVCWLIVHCFSFFLYGNEASLMWVPMAVAGAVVLNKLNAGLYLLEPKIVFVGLWFVSTLPLVSAYDTKLRENAVSVSIFMDVTEREYALSFIAAILIGFYLYIRQSLYAEQSAAMLLQGCAKRVNGDEYALSLADISMTHSQVRSVARKAIQACAMIWLLVLTCVIVLLGVFGYAMLLVLMIIVTMLTVSRFTREVISLIRFDHAMTMPSYSKEEMP